nr:MAG TPA: hypothetical protein [Caudoviricetes sp.]
MEKPVAEVNIKVFKEKNKGYRSENTIRCESNDPDTVLAVMKDFDILQKEFITEMTKELIKDVLEEMSKDD